MRALSFQKTTACRKKAEAGVPHPFDAKRQLPLRGATIKAASPSTSPALPAWR
jgi:hypothetical protein